MGNSLKKKIDECTCKSSCEISKEMKELKNYFKNLSLNDLIKIRAFMENDDSSLQYKIKNITMV